jgi:hypothetical protein
MQFLWTWNLNIGWKELTMLHWQTARSVGWWLVYSERRVLLAGCWWLVCCERKVLLAGG